MAFEHMTYEVILQRMRDRVSAKYPNLDMRESSLISNALAPAALEMAIMYTEADMVLGETFMTTSTRHYLLMHCDQIGMDISVFEPSASVHKGEFNVEIPIGSRWNCELYNYEVRTYLGKNEETGYYEYQMLCETVGAAPNGQTGDLTPITNIPNRVLHASLVECLIEGEDETPTEDIKAAYTEFVRNRASDGNVAQYKLWCSDYDGIGYYKIFPLWNGKNTVKVSILSASNTAASDTLVEEFQNYLDPNSEGMGNGKAPIGAFVTVTTATEVPINVSAKVTLRAGYNDLSEIDKVLTDYLASLAYTKNTVAYLNIGAGILSVEGVDSITDLTVNGGVSDIKIGEEEVPVLGTVNWVVS